MRKIYCVIICWVAILCNGCAGKSATDGQIDQFTKYYQLDQNQYEHPTHGTLRYLNVDFPTAYGKKDVLDTIQRDLIRMIADVNHESPDSALSYGGWRLRFDSIQHSPDTVIDLVLSFDSLYHYGGILNGYDARTLRTTYNKNGIYACMYSYDYYDGGVHAYGTDYAIYDLETGKKIRLGDIYDLRQKTSENRIFRYVLNKPDVEGEGLDQMLEDYTLGMTDTCLIIHYNPGIVSCEALGERVIVIPTNIDSLILNIKNGIKDKEPLTIVPDDYEFGFARYRQEGYNRLTSAMAHRDKKAFARLVEYPLPQPYPMKPLQNEEEVVAAFDRLVPQSLSQRLNEDPFQGWEELNEYRGVRYDNGMMWLTYDSLRLRTISYVTPETNRILERLYAQERQLLGETKDFIPECCYINDDSTIVVHIGRDTTMMSNANDWYGRRIRVIERGKRLTAPTYCVVGKRFWEDHECGNQVYVGQQDSTVIQVWNFNCEYREEGPGTYGMGYGKLAPDADMEDCYNASVYGRQNLSPCYLRDVAKWWNLRR